MLQKEIKNLPRQVGPDAAWGPAGGGDRALKSRENLSVPCKHVESILHSEMDLQQLVLDQKLKPKP